jgi:hypothetical protein
MELFDWMSELVFRALIREALQRVPNNHDDEGTLKGAQRAPGKI